MNEMVKDIIITTNSPGEVAAWVRPVVTRLHERMPETKITVIVLPCTFASGQETNVVNDMMEVTQVLPPSMFYRFLITGQVPLGLNPLTKGSGVVIHLGGDYVMTGLLAKRLKMPAVAYTEGLAPLKQAYRAFCVPYQRARDAVIKRGVDKRRIHVIGNLMLDAIEINNSDADHIAEIGWRPGSANDIIMLMPGSRPYELNHVAPLFIEAAAIMSKSLPEMSFVMALSPFSKIEILKESLPGASIEVIGKEHWRIVTGPRWDKIVIEVLQGKQYDIMRNAAFALTVPGTNTAELAYMGVPTLVNVPLNWPEEIPLEGLPGLIGNIPLIGSFVKRKAVMRVAKRIKFTALPNMVAQREIMPELRGILDGNQIAQRALSIISDKDFLAKTAKDERAVMGESGAADRLIDVVLSIGNGGDEDTFTQ